eukprot:Rmarinus@m.7852
MQGLGGAFVVLLCFFTLASTANDAEVVHVGGIFPLTSVYWFGGPAYNGALYAVDVINRNTTLLPNITLSLDLIDSKCDLLEGVDGVIQQLADGKVIGFYGGGCAPVCEHIAPIATIYERPVLSWACMGSEHIGEEYPYFFLPEQAYPVVKAWVDLMLHYNWTRCAIIYQMDDIFTDTAGMTEGSLVDADIEVVSIQIWRSDEDTGNILENIVLQRVSIIIVMMETANLYSLLSLALEVGLKDPGFAWLSATAFGGGWEDTVSILNSGDPYATPDPLMYILNVQPDLAAGDSFDDWYEGFIDAFPDTPFIGYSAVAYDGMIGFALALQAVLDAGGDVSNGSLLSSFLNRTDVSGPSGRFVVRDPTFGRPCTVSNFLEGPDGSLRSQRIGVYKGETLQITNEVVFPGNTTDVPPDIPSRYPAIAIGGMFPMTIESQDFALNPAGVHSQVAFLLALEDINNKELYPDVLSSTVLKYAAVDTYSSPTSTLETSQRIMNAFGGAGVSVVVGPAYDDVTVTASTMFVTVDVALMSYWATTPLLANLDIYPAVFRVVPNIASLGYALANVLDDMEVARVSLFYEDETTWRAMTNIFLRYYDADYGEEDDGGTANQGNVVVEDYAIKDSTYQSLMDASDPTVSGFVLFASDKFGRQVVEYANRTGLLGKDRVWMVSSRGILSDSDEFDPAYHGSYYSGLCALNNTSIKERIRQKGIEAAPSCSGRHGQDCMCSDSTDDSEIPLWLTDDDRLPATPGLCTGWDFASHTSEDIEDMAVYAYDATVAVAKALDLLISSGHQSVSSASAVTSALSQVAYYAETGQLAFHPIGDRVLGTCFEVLNVQDTTAHTVYKWSNYITSLSDSCKYSFELATGLKLCAKIDTTGVTLVYNTDDGGMPELYCPENYKYLLDGSCEPCANNTYSEGHDQRECTTCGTETCLTCNEGEHVMQDWTGCAPCDPGTYMHKIDHSEEECTPCEKGTSGKNSGLKQCLPCSEVTYQDRTGETVCFACPSNTERSYGSDGIYQVECLCREDYYEPYLRAGEKCESCPEGATCRGEQNPPIALEDYWISPDLSDHTDKGEWRFLLCNKEAGCKGGNYEGTTATLSECREGYTGRMCAACEEGYWRLDNQCMRCQSTSFQFYHLILFLLVGLVWLPMLRQMSATIPSLSCIIAYLQTMDIVGRFNVTWPDVARPFFTVASFFNYNIRLSLFECYWSNDWMVSWVMYMILPILFVGVTLLHLCWKTVVLPRLIDNLDRSFPDIVAWGSKQTWLVKMYPVRGGRILASVDEHIAFFVYTLTVLYIALVLHSVELLPCTEYSEGKFFINNVPDSRCYTEDYNLKVAISAMGILFYVIGIPLTIGIIVCTLGPSTLRNNRRFYHRFYFLCRRYKLEYYWWEVVVLCRKALFVLLRITFSNLVDVQIASSLAMLSFFMVAQFYARPYCLDRYNVLECVLLYCVFLAVLQASTVSWDKEMYKPQGGAFMTIVIFSAVFCLYNLKKDIQVARKKVMARIDLASTFGSPGKRLVFKDVLGNSTYDRRRQLGRTSASLELVDIRRRASLPDFSSSDPDRLFDRASAKGKLSLPLQDHASKPVEGTPRTQDNPLLFSPRTNGAVGNGKAAAAAAAAGENGSNRLNGDTAFLRGSEGLMGQQRPSQPSASAHTLINSNGNGHHAFSPRLPRPPSSPTTVPLAPASGRDPVSHHSSLPMLRPSRVSTDLAVDVNGHAPGRVRARSRSSSPLPLPRGDDDDDPPQHPFQSPHSPQPPALRPHSPTARAPFFRNPTASRPSESRPSSPRIVSYL